MVSIFRSLAPQVCLPFACPLLHFAEAAKTHFCPLLLFLLFLLFCTLAGLNAGDEYQATWAKYLSKWVTAYEAQGLPVWGITVQNEPEFAAPREACK